MSTVFFTKGGERLKKAELKELYGMMFPEYSDIVIVGQLREMLGISIQLAYEIISDGSLHAVKIGNAFKIPKASVIYYMMNDTQKAASAAS